MDPRLSFLTLIVRDLARSRAFYVDALGWTPELDVPGQVLMVRVADRVVLSLWQEDAAASEIGAVGRGHGAPPFTLAHNVREPEEVDSVMDALVAAGATLERPAATREWGGRSGYVADPDGFLWEIAYNPGPIGRSVLGEA